MPKEKIQHLITDLHERFGDSITSPQQEALIEQLNRHVHDMNTEEPADPDFIDTVDELIKEMEVEHPAATGVLSQVLEILKNIGV